MLQAKNEKQIKKIDEILGGISHLVCHDGTCISIDENVQFDKLAELVDYLRSINSNKCSLDLTIVEPQMMEAVKTWLAYKKEKGQSYKPIGFRTFYNKLCELSKNNPNIAMAIIEQSMQNNYAGLFPIKRNGTSELPLGFKLEGDVREKMKELPQQSW